MALHPSIGVLLLLVIVATVLVQPASAGIKKKRVIVKVPTKVKHVYHEHTQKVHIHKQPKYKPPQIHIVHVPVHKKAKKPIRGKYKGGGGGWKESHEPVSWEEDVSWEEEERPKHKKSRRHRRPIKYGASEHKFKAIREHHKRGVDAHNFKVPVGWADESAEEHTWKEPVRTNHASPWEEEATLNAGVDSTEWSDDIKGGWNGEIHTGKGGGWKQDLKNDKGLGWKEEINDGMGGGWRQEVHNGRGGVWKGDFRIGGGVKDSPWKLSGTSQGKKKLKNWSQEDYGPWKHEGGTGIRGSNEWKEQGVEVGQKHAYIKSEEKEFSGWGAESNGWGKVKQYGDPGWPRGNEYSDEWKHDHWAVPGRTHNYESTRPHDEFSAYDDSQEHYHHRHHPKQRERPYRKEHSHYSHPSGQQHRYRRQKDRGHVAIEHGYSEASTQQSETFSPPEGGYKWLSFSSQDAAVAAFNPSTGSQPAIPDEQPAYQETSLPAVIPTQSQTPHALHESSPSVLIVDPVPKIEVQQNYQVPQNPTVPNYGHEQDRQHYNNPKTEDHRSRPNRVLPSLVSPVLTQEVQTSVQPIPAITLESTTRTPDEPLPQMNFEFKRKPTQPFRENRLRTEEKKEPLSEVHQSKPFGRPDPNTFTQSFSVKAPPVQFGVANTQPEQTPDTNWLKPTSDTRGKSVWHLNSVIGGKGATSYSVQVMQFGNESKKHVINTVHSKR